MYNKIKLYLIDKMVLYFAPFIMKILNIELEIINVVVI
jgi:hypothetical protein